MRLRKVSASASALILMLGILSFIGARADAAVNSYIVMLKDQPDPSKATAADLKNRREALYKIALETASRSQVGVVAYLRQMQGTGQVQKIRCFYVVNACAFTGESSVADALRARPDVRSVSVDEVVKTPIRDPGTEPPLWHMDRIKARDAWRAGFDGTGITIGSIDTGADVSHPAIRSQYRGNTTGGWSNDYNWFDAWSFRSDPIDLNGHGTHTLGTALGGDGLASVAGSNTDIGIAYRSKWMAAKAFDDNGEGLTSSVLLAMQWMQFPTDIFGNVRTDLAPDVVSNAWSVDAAGAPAGCRAWFSVVLKMWQRANILPVFSVGEDGAPHSPGDLPEAFSVGATDAADRKTGFSAEGDQCPAPGTKPDIHAPGVSIYSSYKAGTNVTKNGTSMAAAQAAGAAALMLQAAGGSGSLLVTETAQAMVASADLCTDHPSCRKRLNVLRGVQQVQRGAVIRGTVKEGSAPVQGAKVTVSTPGDNDRTVTTDALGNYAVYNLEAGTYSVSARKYSYITQTKSAAVAANATTVVDFSLVRSTSFVNVTGRVTYESSGEPAVSTTVSLIDTPLVTTTDVNGNYSFVGVPDPSVPDSSEPRGYDYILDFRPEPCSLRQTQQIMIKDAPTPNVYNASLLMKRDGFGYTCAELPFDWKGGTEVSPLKADDGAVAADLAFAFPFYENRVPGGGDRQTRAFRTIYISVDGYIRFDGVGTEYLNGPIPDYRVPNGAIYGLWDDLYMDEASQILTDSGTDWFTVEWRDMTFKLPGQGRITFSVTIHQNGDIEMRYLSATGADASGKGATIGLENAAGSIAFDYSYNEPTIRSGLYVYYSAAAKPARITGTVSGSDGPVLPGAKVVASGNGFTHTTFTGSGGRYQMRLESIRPDMTPITYSLTASKFHYDPQTKSATPSYGGVTVVDFTLARQPDGAVTGVVRDLDTAAGLGNVPVSLGDPNIPDVRTDTNGNFAFAGVPVGTYTVATVGTGRCRPNVSQSGVVVTTGSTSTVGLTMSKIRDGFGYRCEDFDPASNSVLTGVPLFPTGSRDMGSATLSLPFNFPIYGEVTSTAYVSVDGHITFDGPSVQPGNDGLLTSASPNLGVYPFWDDLEMDATSDISADGATAGSDSVRIRWSDMLVKADASRITFETTLYSNGNFDFAYISVEPGTAGTGTGATIGSESAAGRWAFRYSRDETMVRSGHLIQFISPSNSGGGGTVTGVRGLVKESVANAGVYDPINGVDIVVGNGLVTGTASTNIEGRYEIEVPPGANYRLYANKSGYRLYQHPTLITVPTSGFAEVNFQMQRIGTHTLTIKVNDQNGPGNRIADFDFLIRCASIYSDPQCSRTDATIPATSDISGKAIYTLTEGTYVIESLDSVGCQMAASLTVTLSDANPNPEVDLNVPLRRDAYGNSCIKRQRFRSGTGLVPIPVSLSSPIPIPLPFKFRLYGFTADLAYVYGDSGKIRLADLDDPIFEPSGPTIHVFDDHIRLDPSSSVSLKYDQGLVTFQWTNVPITNDVGTPTGDRITFAVTLSADVGRDLSNPMVFQYEPQPKAPGLEPTDRARGSLARIGISDCTEDLELFYADRPGFSVLDLVGIRGVTSLTFEKRFATLGATNGCNGLQ